MLTTTEIINLTKPNITRSTIQHQLSHITMDSRKVTDKSIFCAVQGAKADGHHYIKQAILNGAKVILCSELPKRCNDKVTYIQVDNISEVIPKVADRLYNHPSSKLHVIGVTGTNGKTSITRLIKRIYEYNDIKVGSIGTLGVTLQQVEHSIPNTTPVATELQKLLANMVSQGITNAVMEVSSHGLELKRVNNVDFDIGIFTNLTPDHLNFHGDMESYYRAKKKLFFMTKQANIINIDDPFGRRLYNELKKDGYPVISYGIYNGADYQATLIKTDMKGTLFSLRYKDKVKKVISNTPGIFSVYNYLAAMAATYTVGIPMNYIIASFQNYKGAPGRFEMLPTQQDYSVILDFAHTPDGLENVLQTISQITKGRIILVFGAGGDRDKSRRFPMGQVAGRYTDYCIITKDNPRFEDPMVISLEIDKGIKETHCNYDIILERDEAIYHAINTAEKGDTVLLAGKAYEMYQVIRGEKVYYDERTTALQAIASRVSS